MNKRGNMATRRLKEDYMRLIQDPVPYVKAHPLHQNILEWHFAVLGPDDTPYKGGVYHGKLVFPGEFPFKPPSIYMITPNGRFKCNKRLCLSISDFHPETWNPAWSVATILTGLLSFMVEKNPTLGSIETSDYEKQLLATRSLEFNLKDPIFCELFPDLVEVSRKKLRSSNYNAQHGFNLHSGATSAILGKKNDILGELQMAHICFLVAYVYDAFEHWKNLVQILCSVDSGLEKYTQLLKAFLMIFHYQLKEISTDFFVDITSENNFLVKTQQNSLKMLKIVMPMITSKLLPIIFEKSYNYI